MQYADVVFYLRIFLASMAWVVVLFLWRGKHTTTSFWFKMYFAIHVALFYSGLTIAIVYFGYVGPSILVTSWAYAIVFHALFAVSGGPTVDWWLSRNGTHG